MIVELAPSALAEAVESCRLPAPAFRHRHHVQLGWHYLSTRPLLDAVVHFGRVVARFAEHHGAPGKYDEALTVAYMLLIEERRRRSPDADWDGFEAENVDLLENGRALLAGRLAGVAQSPNTRAALPARKSASASPSSSSSTS